MGKRGQQLGVNYTTAVYRLQRRLLFNFAQRLGLDTCFRCGEKIEDVADFSVEHKKPWLDVDPSLFWDIDNIAFSHHRCNSGAARRTDEVRKACSKMGKATSKVLTDSGTAWCGGHKDYLAVHLFNKNRRNPSGYSSYCKDCRKKYG